MLIVPEIRTVFIFPPKTASGSLRRALMARFPRSMLLYRHMEADGVPVGYDRWHKIGIVRNPSARLRSVYTFSKNVADSNDPSHPDWTWMRMLKASTDGLTYEEWLQRNEVPFTGPMLSCHTKFQADHTLRHVMPENRKSQWHYLRPDLGTEVVCMRDIDSLAFRWELELRVDINQSVEGETFGDPTRSQVTDAEFEILRRYHQWELNESGVLLTHAV